MNAQSIGCSFRAVSIVEVETIRPRAEEDGKGCLRMVTKEGEVSVYRKYFQERDGSWSVYENRVELRGE